MELKIIENKNNKIVAEIIGADHTLANMIAEELWNDSSVKASGYSIEHPLKDKMRFIIETDGKETPKDALKKAITRLKKSIKELEKIMVSSL